MNFLMLGFLEKPLKTQLIKTFNAIPDINLCHRHFFTSPLTTIKKLIHSQQKANGR